ncbi:MAG: hypothetical protein ACRBB5_04360 [Nitrosopumilus sp.]
MTSFLITKKDNKSYEEKLSSSPESSYPLLIDISHLLKMLHSKMSYME